MRGIQIAALPLQINRLAPKRYPEDRSNRTPPERRESTRANVLLRNLEKELAVETGATGSSRRNSSSSSSSTSTRVAEAEQAKRPSVSDLHELRYGARNSSVSSPSQPFGLRNKEDPVFAPSSSLRPSDEPADSWSDLSSSIPSSQPPKNQAGRTFDNSQDEYDESGWSSSRLSNSGGCSSSGAGLTQSFADMSLRSGYGRPQEQRGSRSNSLSRSSETRLQSNRERQVCGGLVGLMNEGNTCFLNSCLQCLAHTSSLAAAILGQFSDLIRSKGSAARSRRDLSSLSDMLAYAFRQLLKDLCGKPSYSTASASLLLQSLQGLSPQFAGNRQHDAQEAMRTIIDGLHEALNRKPAGRPKCPEPPPTTPEAEIADICWDHHRMWNNSVIQDIFCGQLQSTIECSVCQRKSHCFDPFLDLSLPLPKSGLGSDSLRSFSSRSSSATIEDCLSAFVAPETLDSSNKYYCSNCKLLRKRFLISRQAPQISTKKLSIYRAPSVLVLHIKRFYGIEPRSYRKDDRSVSYPLTGLDLSSFMSGTAKRALKHKATTYDLYGVCSHFGSLGYGHYTATCRSVDNGWYCFNDSSVTAVHDPVDSSAYILFYQQRG